MVADGVDAIEVLHEVSRLMAALMASVALADVDDPRIAPERVLTDVAHKVGHEHQALVSICGEVMVSM